MYVVRDVSDWEVDELVVTSGRRGKDWLIEPQTSSVRSFQAPPLPCLGGRGGEGRGGTESHLWRPTADTDLAVRNRVQGIISYKFLTPDEHLQMAAHDSRSLMPP